MAFTEADLLPLEEAIKNGVRRVDYKDKSVTYATMADLILARDTVRAEVNKDKRNRNRQIRTNTKSGL